MGSSFIPGHGRLQLSDLPRQLETSAVDPRFHRAFGQLQLVRDFLVRELLQIPQHHGGAERGGQLGQRLAQQLAQVRMLGERVRAALLRVRRQLRRVDVARHRLAFLADAAVVIDAEVPADADQPRLEIRAAIERLQRLENLDEDVLREIFRLVMLADELVGEVVHLAPVLPDDQVPGLLIAGKTPLDQQIGRGISYDWRYRHLEGEIISRSPSAPFTIYNTEACPAFFATTIGSSATASRSRPSPAT